MKTKIIMLLLTFFVSTQASNFEGLWFTTGNESVVEIKKVGSHYEGAIVWMMNPLDKNGNIQVDANNPKKHLRTQPVQNLVILKNFQFSKGLLKKGEIYDPENGKTYSCTIKMKNNSLEVRGFIGVAMIGRTVIWNRCEAIPQ